MIPELAAAIDRGEPVVLATVVRTSRSVPRRPGSKMLVFADGRTLGTVGGGMMEHNVTLEAADVLALGAPRLVSYRLVDPGSGDPGVCGGDVDIYLEPYVPAPMVYVIGAGHVGRAVGQLATRLGFRSVIWDDRAELAEAPDVDDTTDLIVSGELERLLESRPATPRDSFVLVTRGSPQDVELLPRLLREPAGYIGVIGSRRRWRTTCDALIAAGVDEHALERVRSPIGIEIGAETPEEIAVSILAELIAHRRAGQDLAAH